MDTIYLLMLPCRLISLLLFDLIWLYFLGVLVRPIYCSDTGISKVAMPCALHPAIHANLLYDYGQHNLPHAMPQTKVLIVSDAMPPYLLPQYIKCTFRKCCDFAVTRGPMPAVARVEHVL